MPEAESAGTMGRLRKQALLSRLLAGLACYGIAGVRVVVHIKYHVVWITKYRRRVF